MEQFVIPKLANERLAAHYQNHGKSKNNGIVWKGIATNRI
jgi:hypothetical protein